MPRVGWKSKPIPTPLFSNPTADFACPLARKERSWDCGCRPPQPKPMCPTCGGFAEKRIPGATVPHRMITATKIPPFLFAAEPIPVQAVRPSVSECGTTRGAS